MTHICNSIQIRQPIEEVFDFITTPANWPQWHPASVSVSGNADHSLLQGEEVTEDISGRGQVTWLVRERSAPRRWVIDGNGKDGGRATITYTLDPGILPAQISNASWSTRCRTRCWRSWIG